MTAEQWATCEDPGAMLAACRRRQRGGDEQVPAGAGVSDRKLRLYAIACVRQVWHRLTSEQRVKVALNEREPWHQAATGPVHAVYLSQDALTAYTGSVGDDRSINYAVNWLGGYDAVEVAEQAPAWLQRVMLFQTQADILRDTAGDPFAPATLTRTVACDRCDGKWPRVPSVSCGTCYGLGFIEGDAGRLTPTVVSLAQAAYDDRGSRCEKCHGKGGWWHRPGCGGEWAGDVGPDRSAGDHPFLTRKKCPQCKDGVIDDGTLDPERLAVLSDTLEEAGCRQGHPLLAALRSPGPKYRGFWAIDVLLGKD